MVVWGQGLICMEIGKQGLQKKSGALGTGVDCMEIGKQGLQKKKKKKKLKKEGWSLIWDASM